MKIIGKGEFSDCSSLHRIDLPNCVEEIGLNAFRNSGIQYFTAPKSLKIIHQGAFYLCCSLCSVILNEGLEVLGTDEPLDVENVYGVFQQSPLESIVLPSTLKRIEHDAFRACTELHRIKLPDGLETICAECFYESGLEEVALPPSVREVHPYAFFRCMYLRCAQLNEGLEKLGEKRVVRGEEFEGGTFARSRIETIRIPSTVKAIEVLTFA